jgi:hypothetical protein
LHYFETPQTFVQLIRGHYARECQRWYSSAHRSRHAADCQLHGHHSGRQLWNSPQAPYVYEGTINGTKLVLGIVRLRGNNYQFDAAGSPVAFAGTKNPVTVSLTVGNDTGRASVNAVISSH